MARKRPKDQKVSEVMSEFQRGNLRSGSGEQVTDRDQAIAIALSEARKAAQTTDSNN